MTPDGKAPFMHLMRQFTQLTEAAFQFHRDLNSKLWHHNMLKPIVRLKLFQTAVAFYKFLDINRLVVSDIIVTGSNAAYNYTSLSDIDVHLIVDYTHTSCPRMADNLFLTKKALWAQTYGVTILGFPVELYVEDVANPVHANGIFSILHNHWLKEPSPVRPSADDTAVQNKLEAYAGTINELLSGDPSIKDIDKMLLRLRTLRSNGLLSGGEFSNENITYKRLRDTGCIGKLYQKRVELQDQQLSL
jgi:hypothetical protein